MWRESFLLALRMVARKAFFVGTMPFIGVGGFVRGSVSGQSLATV
jgi:hypothetical protein